MGSSPVFIICLVDLISFLATVTCQTFPPGATVCKTGYGYPLYCPQPGDSPEHTKCCRHYYTSKCCKERATKVCATKTNSKMGKSNWDPDLSWVAVWCPQDDEPDDHTACSYNNGQVGCFSYKVLIGIIAGVFGGIFLILLSIGIGCFICYKKGKLVCVKVRPGKYTVRKVSKEERQQQQQQRMQNRQQPISVHQQRQPELQSQNSHQWQNYPPKHSQGQNYHSGMSGYI